MHNRLASVTAWPHRVNPPITPTAQAADARLKAASAEGPQRAYWLWLAGEWDKTAARQGHAARELFPAGGHLNS